MASLRLQTSIRFVARANRRRQVLVARDERVTCRLSSDHAIFGIVPFGRTCDNGCLSSNGVRFPRIECGCLQTGPTSRSNLIEAAGAPTSGGKLTRRLLVAKLDKGGATASVKRLLLKRTENAPGLTAIFKIDEDRRLTAIKQIERKTFNDCSHSPCQRSLREFESYVFQQYLKSLFSL